MSSDKENGRSLIKKSSSSCCQKAIRVRFYRNGDRYFTGFTFPVAYSRYKEFDMLLRDLSNSTFCDTTILPCGVRFVFAVDGARIKNISQMEEGGSYVCSSSNVFIPFDYVNGTQNPKWKTTKKFVDDVVPLLPFKNSQKRYRSMSCASGSVYPPGKNSAKILTVLRSSTGRPRQIFQWLLNRKTAPTFGKVLDELSALLKLDSGCVNHLYTSEGKEITTVEELFQEDLVLIAFGSEYVDRSDIFLSAQELNAVEKIRKPSGKPCGEGKEDYSSVPVNVLESNGLFKLTEKYLIGNEIGVGHFAVVKECKEKKRDVHLALKIIDRSKCEKSKDKIATEISILRKLRHANVVGLINKYETNDFIYLIMELCEDGNLLNFLLKNKCYSEQDLSGMIHNIASGLQYLHGNSIVHRDIKFENILIKKDSTGLTRLRICDFGLASMNDMIPIYAVCGTPHYMAPEILTQTGYDFKIDIWSLGVMFYILLAGSPPFASENNDFNEIFEKILRGDYDEITDLSWDRVSPEAKALLSQLLERDPKDRYSAKQILNFPWVAEDNIARSINLWPQVERRIVPFLANFTESSRDHPYNFLAKTSLDKESNYFETEEERK